MSKGGRDICQKTLIVMKSSSTISIDSGGVDTILQVLIFIHV